MHACWSFFMVYGFISIKIFEKVNKGLNSKQFADRSYL